MVTALGYISYSWEVNKPQDCQTDNEILFYLFNFSFICYILNIQRNKWKDFIKLP